MGANERRPASFPAASCVMSRIDIWLGWMSSCSASCTTVRSPLTAAIATFALKAGVWFRRGLLLMLSPDSRAKSCPLSGRSSIIALCKFLKLAL